jgi:hypothetical protein
MLVNLYALVTIADILFKTKGLLLQIVVEPCENRGPEKSDALPWAHTFSSRFARPQRRVARRVCPTRIVIVNRECLCRGSRDPSDPAPVESTNRPD